MNTVWSPTHVPLCTPSFLCIDSHEDVHPAKYFKQATTQFSNLEIEFCVRRSAAVSGAEDASVSVARVAPGEPGACPGGRPAVPAPHLHRRHQRLRQARLQGCRRRLVTTSARQAAKGQPSRTRVRRIGRGLSLLRALTPSRPSLVAGLAPPALRRSRAEARAPVPAPLPATWRSRASPRACSTTTRGRRRRPTRSPPP